MEKKVTVFEPHHGHPRREWERKPFSCCPEILQRAIHNADIQPQGLVLI
jgi:hypothetical protein